MTPTSNPQYFSRFSTQTQQPVSNLPVNGCLKMPIGWVPIFTLVENF